MDDTFPTQSIAEVIGDWRGAMKIGPFGSALPRREMVGTGVKVYGQENLINQDWSIGDRRVSYEKYLSLQSCELETGDVVISMMGSLGHCEVFPASAEPGIMDSHLLRMQVNADLVLPKFLRAFLRSEEASRQIVQQSHGSIMAGLSSTVVKRMRIPLPTLDEQQEIVRILELVDNAIKLAESQLEKLGYTRKGLEADLLSGRVRTLAT
jgi:type I restriction enzyme S subunit